jgi:hypothetical protein
MKKEQPTEKKKDIRRRHRPKRFSHCISLVGTEGVHTTAGVATAELLLAVTACVVAAALGLLTAHAITAVVLRRTAHGALLTDAAALFGCARLLATAARRERERESKKHSRHK